VLALLGAALLLSACSAATPAASGAATPGATPTDAPPPSLELRDVAVTPAQRAEAGIAAAFDAAEAADLVDSVPADLDLARDALICVYLGARPSGTWSLTLQSASIVDGELRIVAREKASNGPSAVTYPADCAVLNREALPAGTLPVRADDTTTDEFITDGTLSVPNATNAP
jgi:hypothetical protein